MAELTELEELTELAESRRVPFQRLERRESAVVLRVKSWEIRRQQCLILRFQFEDHPACHWL